MKEYQPICENSIYDINNYFQEVFSLSQIQKENFPEINEERYLKDFKPSFRKLKLDSYLVATQKWLKNEKIDKLLKTDISKLSPPVVYKFNNKYYVLDGHHRIIASKIKKERNIRVMFFDMDKDMKKYADYFIRRRKF